MQWLAEHLLARKIAVVVVTQLVPDTVPPFGQDVVPVAGPVPELADEVRRLHERAARGTASP